MFGIDKLIAQFDKLNLLYSLYKPCDPCDTVVSKKKIVIVLAGHGSQDQFITSAMNASFSSVHLIGKCSTQFHPQVGTKRHLVMPRLRSYSRMQPSLPWPQGLAHFALFQLQNVSDVRMSLGTKMEKRKWLEMLDFMWDMNFGLLDESPVSVPLLKTWWLYNAGSFQRCASFPAVKGLTGLRMWWQRAVTKHQCAGNMNGLQILYKVHYFSCFELPTYPAATEICFVTQLLLYMFDYIFVNHFAILCSAGHTWLQQCLM